MKNLILISGSESTRRVVLHQLEELFENNIEIESYSTDEGINKCFYNSVVVLTTSLIYNECKAYFDDI